MLPDFPKEKQLLEKYWNEFLAQKNQELLGVFGTIPSFTVHEGDRWKISRADGNSSEQQYQEMSSGLTINLNEVPDLTPEKIKEKLTAVAEDAARQMSQEFFKELKQVTEQTGNAIDAEGKPITQDLFLELFEKVESEFTPDGQMIPPSIVMHPEMWKAAEPKLREWEKDKNFIDRQTAIINKKREEWYAREASRKPVD